MFSRALKWCLGIAVTIVVLYAVSWFLLPALQIADGGRQDPATVKPMSGLLEVGGETFFLSEKYKGRYSSGRLSDPATQVAYKQIELIVDIDTFESSTQNNEKENLVYIEIRPQATEFGEKYYWTDKDPIYRYLPLMCASDKKYAGKAYDFCEHGKEAFVTGWSGYGYSIRDKNSSKYVAMINCNKASAESSLNQICVGRSLVLKGIQVEYHYRASHLNRAVEINERILQLVASLRVNNGEGN